MGYQQLVTEERHKIAAMRSLYLSVEEIARRLGRHRSTLYRELKRNASAHDGNYRASHSVQKASGRKSRSRRNGRFGADDFVWIERLIRLHLSPEQIVGRMRQEGTKVMSHETIYRWIWKEKAEGSWLWTYLRGARKQRRKRYGPYDSRGRLAGKKMIGSRPASVESRKRIGHWESKRSGDRQERTRRARRVSEANQIDTVHGKSTACVLTVVERRTGLVRLGALRRATKELTTRRTLSLLGKEAHRVRTITADNGCEFHDYKKIETGLKIDFYFAKPHHAWERGSNENTNGLLRQYLPKGTDLAGLTQPQCNRLAEILNNRPRKRLGYKTPNEVYYSRPVVALQS
ncbi:MAG: IS30 family transposase [Verrucomicrobiaceae bacterium]|nr:IS30 family transposase [Verrucomicrobiaceae bacterium]